MEFADEILKQIPALAVLAWIVRFGILAWQKAQAVQAEHEQSMQKAYLQSLKSHEAFLVQLHQDHREDGRENRIAMREVKETLQAVGQTNAGLLEAVRRINGVVAE